MIRNPSIRRKPGEFISRVVLSIVVDQTGHARDIRVARSVGLGLDEKAIEAIKKWKFAPGLKDGHPVAVGVNVEGNFRLY
jgi:TonB family protein